MVLPAWEEKRASFVFFFVFVYAGVFFLTSIILALVSAVVELLLSRLPFFKGPASVRSVHDMFVYAFLNFSLLSN